MDEIINLYVSNMTKSINLVIKCKRLITILDLKKLVAKELDTYACLFRLTNGTNLEENLDVLLSDLNINNDDRLYFMNKLNIERAVLEVWFRQDGHNWHRNVGWCSDLPLSEWQGVTTNEKGKIIVLNFYRNNISVVPPEISQLTNLTTLVLQDNNISVVPPEISQLTNLTILDLSYNNIFILPIELSQLINLESLYLSHNNISLFPKELSQLTNLSVLGLSHNNLNLVPIEMSQLTELTWLHLSNNNLISVPSEFSQLTKLTHLYVISSNNNIAHRAFSITISKN